MIELVVVLIGITILIQLLSFVFSTTQEKDAYAFIMIDDRCEVVCALEKLMP